MLYSEFLEENSNRLVKVNDDDDNITGWYRLLETESGRAQNYSDQGYQVFSIGEANGEEEIVVQGLLTNPYVTGYFICYVN